MYPVFAALVESFIRKAMGDGLSVALFMGDRTFEQQDQLYALGRTVKNHDGVAQGKPMGRIITRARGGESWHNYGLAADIVFKTGKKWSWAEEHPWVTLGLLGESMGLEWGNGMGRDGMEKWDRPHFQLARGLKISQAKTIYAAGGLEAVWNEIAKRGRPEFIAGGY